MIEDAIATRQFTVSPLVLAELTFVLAKLGQLPSQGEILQYFQKFSTPSIDKIDIGRAVKIALEMDVGKSMNDLVHLVHAERQGCSKIVTFDKGFSRFAGKADVELVVL